MRDGKNKEEDMILRDSDGIHLRQKTLLISPQNTLWHTSALISKSGKGCSPPYGTCDRPGSQGSWGGWDVLRLWRAGAHSGAGSSLLRSHCSFPAARLHWDRDCCFTHARGNEPEQAAEPTLPGVLGSSCRLSTSITPGNLGRPQWGNAMSCCWAMQEDTSLLPALQHRGSIMSCGTQ